MIYCPKCGTANRDGSRFCNECGETLGTHTALKCPACGTMNPVQNVFCNECGERLVSFPAEDAGAEAQPAIKGLSLPIKGAAEEDPEPEPDSVPDEVDDDTPAWLRELQASLKGEAGGGGLDSDPEDAEVPDWLKDLEAPLPGRPESAAPEPVEPQPEPELPEPQPEPEPPSPVAERDADLEPEDPAAFEAGADSEADAGQDGFPEWLTDFQGDTPGEEPLEPEAGPEEVEEEPLPVEVEAAPGEPDSPTAEVPEEPDTTDELPAEVEEAPGWSAEYEEEEPAWLADLDDIPAPEEEAEPEETPDWLVDLYADVPPGAEPPDLEEMPAAEAEAEPEELSELEGEPEAGEELEAAEEPEEMPELEGEPEAGEELAAELETGEIPEAEAEAGAVPDWLDELEPEGMEEPLETGPDPDFGDLTEAELEGAEVPDWLRELEPEGMAGSLAFEDEAPAEAEEEVSIPEWVEPEESADWLAVLPAAEDEEEHWPLPEEEPVAGALEEPDEAVPDWLTEVPEGEEEEDAGRAAEIALAAAVPAWLADLPPDREDEPLPGDELLSEGDLPEWLVPGEAGLEEPTLERAEIPDWLMQLKPQEVRRAEGEEVGALAAVEEEIEESGILAGIQGVLPIEMAIATPRVALPAEADLAPAETTESRLFAEIVSRPAAVAAQTVERPPKRLLDQVPRWIIYAVLIAVVALPLVFDTSLLTRTFPTAPEADAPYYAPVTGLHSAIDSLAAGAAVLVAFDYDPAASSEMDMVARPVLDHLMERQVPILALSLLPAGPPTAQKLLDDVAAVHPGYTYGQNYVNLGYYPGQAAAVRRLAQPEGLVADQDFAGTPAGELPVLQGITDLAGVALVIELAPTQESVRWWIEQAGTPADVRLGAAVSASVEPLIRPYYETEPRQLEGIVGGVTGTALYEVLRSDSASPSEATTARLNAQLLGTIVFALVLLVGNVVYFAQRGLGRDR